MDDKRRQDLRDHVHGLGLDVHNEYDTWIYISRSSVTIWDVSTLRHEEVDDELMDHIMDSSEFDHDLYCMLLYTIGLDARVALAMSLSNGL